MNPIIGYDFTGRPVYQAPVYGQTQIQPAPQIQQQATTQPAQQMQPQIRSGGIVCVANEDEARRYPVAPGYTVTMRDENAPYLYEKTMGFSAIEPPVFRKARVIFEDAQQAAQEPAGEPTTPAVVYAELAQVEALRDAVAGDMHELHRKIEKETAELRSLISAMIKPDNEPKRARKKEADEE